MRKMMSMTTYAKDIQFVTEIISILLIASLVASEPPKFGYSGSIGPKFWGSLSSNYSLCSNGTLQSPIDIAKDEAKYNSSLENLQRDYANTNATLINNGFNIELRFQQGVGTILVDGKKYSLLQTHWHSPAEHRINGKRYPVELHLVHKTLEGDIAVVAVLYEYGHPDAFLNQLKDSLELLETETRRGYEGARIPAGVIDTKALSRATRKYYRYIGSLTSPPCTEKVIWNILGKVRQMTPQQAAALKAPLLLCNRNNSRPLQALNGRTVNLYHTTLSA
ncbi:putative alpha carbonic anhydrase 1, chloroplastic [Iris pallida]|uniref:Alpha carbonic anhydrase 1, chloroplastic n=1 Tax=Iris pallida TaxID=29817 RepID=A0AAX6ICJ3_IRIPA|nr:putative alpha carbonic anhydrase 1, chloroplastic [Iris pallida]